jgi:hypothetical protein
MRTTIAETAFRDSWKIVARPSRSWARSWEDLSWLAELAELMHSTLHANDRDVIQGKLDKQTFPPDAFDAPR